ncbi:MAG TPA: hypothetical protein VIV63_00110, partial [Steroidobacteraceae bacterium]
MEMFDASGRINEARHSSASGFTLAIPLLFIITGTAVAQTPPPPPPAESEAEAEGLEAIVVTARRRAERLQDTPVAVTALSAEALERQQIVSTTDL